MKDAFYFSHDQNARNDVKMKAMIKRYGMAGYGRFWVLIEMMREQEGHFLTFDDFTFIALSVEFNIDEIEAKAFIDDLVNVFQLLESDDDTFWSPSLLRRMEIREDIRKKRSEAGRASAAKRAETLAKKRATEARKKAEKASQLLALQEAENQEVRTSVQQNSTSVEQVKESKGKESKVKEEKNTKKRSVSYDEVELRKKKVQNATHDAFGSTILNIDGELTKSGDLPFEELLQKFGKRSNKTKAMHFWLNMTQEEQSQAMQAVDGFVKSHSDIKFRPNIHAYLENELYLDTFVDNDEKEQNEKPNITSKYTNEQKELLKKFNQRRNNK